MRTTEPEVGFVGLSEFMTSLVQEVAEAIHTAEVAQSENEEQLKTVASLGVDAAVAELASAEAARELVDGLMAESGADADWAAQHHQFVGLVLKRLGETLTAPRDFTRRGLTAAGRARSATAAGRVIAGQQMEVVHRLLYDGMPRVKVASGSLSVKLEMRAYIPEPDDPQGRKTARGTRQRVAVKGPDQIGADPDGMRISVRPAQRVDGEASGIFGEVAISFVVV